MPRLLAKRSELTIARRRLRRLMNSYGPETAVVFSHVKTKTFLDSTGYLPRADGPLLIGQHHSQFESLVDEPSLREALPLHFGDIDAFTTLTDEDAHKFEHLIPAPCFGVANPLQAGWTPSFASRPNKAVALARFSHEKQLDLMVRAFARATAAPDLSEWTLDIYGSGKEEGRIRSAIEASGSQGRIRLMGPTTSPETVYRQAAITLSSSNLEGFGLTILEAAACGTPSLAFDCSPGVRSLIRPDTGLLVRPLTEEAYAQALRGALSDPDRLAQMGRAASERAQQFSPDRIVDRWGAILSEAERQHSRRFSSAG
ncbi:glycosyltransferase [Acidipropionibacterium jensenii]|nr:glycosyltransferase [Acidipropionibacterium jensenii]